MNINNNVVSIQTNIQKINNSAKNIANISQEKEINLVKEFNEQMISTNAIKNNASVIQTNDELFETLLDLKV